MNLNAYMPVAGERPLDSILQDGGFCIAMDPNTGEILAWANSPTFDPNDPWAVSDPVLLQYLADIESGEYTKEEAYQKALAEGATTEEARDTAISAAESEVLYKQWANRSISTLNSVMIEYINGMKLIKAYNMGSKSFQKFSDAIREENAMWNETSRRMGPPYAAFVVIIECGMLLMVPLGGMFFLRGSLTASAFLLFLYVGSLYLTEIRPLQELGTNFANVLGAVTKAKEILDIPVYQGGSDFPENHDIELRNVRFSYDGKTDVLQGVNLKIKDGERMALVGQSGAGKSTIIELVSRFYDVQEGEVLIGGKNVKELDYDTILKNVAIVFQKTFLTRDSVLENIRMGSSASLEEVRAAAKEAQIDDFIMSLPDGYDTKVGSFGSRFSGGEKQRIAIARAILKNAPILILDEATSASDPENQMEIDKAIQNLCRGKTVIVVAHRLSDLKLCDRVAVVENHTITCIGTHEEVRRKNAYYRKAWEDYEKARNITYQLEGGEGNA